MSFKRFAVTKAPVRNIKQVHLGMPPKEQVDGDDYKKLLENTVFLTPIQKVGKVKKIPEKTLQLRPELRSISEATVIVLGEDEAGRLLIETAGNLLHKIPVCLMDYLYLINP